MSVLSQLGFQVDIASRLSTRCTVPDALPALQQAAEMELDRCLAAEAKAPKPASLVFTYHNYYKAPDLIGPALAKALSLPYVIAESSRAPRRAQGEWAAGHLLAETASEAANLIIAPTAHDKVMLDKLRPQNQTIVHLKPFIELSDWPSANMPRSVRSQGSVRLLTIAMMRTGNKAQSYAVLADILRQLGDLDWSLDIVGDGERRHDVEELFSAFGRRVCFHGAFDDKTRMGNLLRSADIFVWPAIDEPIGMVFLEAQAHDLPSIAFGYRGVPDVIENAISGFVIAPGQIEMFVSRLRDMITNPALLAQCGVSARLNFLKQHSMQAAALKVAAAFKSAGLPFTDHSTGEHHMGAIGPYLALSPQARQ
jgi:glycosyltransferase involved in cell wall biosynthesis